MKRKIEFSIISPGTEKYIKTGYMAVSVLEDDKTRKIYDCDHGITEVDKDLRNMSFFGNYEIENIAFSRFELISNLIHKRINLCKNDKYLLLGFGSLGIATLINFIENGFDNIDIFIRNKSEREVNAINLINEKYKKNIRLIDTINYDYNVYIDTTGSSKILKEIIESAIFFSTFLILGTPREESFLINPLLIHRNNHTVIGIHEFNGVSIKQREEMFEELLKKNSTNSIIKNFVTIKPYLQNNKRTNFIEVYKYDLQNK